MDADIHKKDDINKYRLYKNLKIENERLFTQNCKLIRNLEEITLEFSKSQTKLKEIALSDENKSNINGNLNKFLDQIKLLESDNRQLCEALSNELNMNKVQSATVKEEEKGNTKFKLDLKAQKSASEEKILNLKNHIQELQKQLIKTQKIAFENECNYKVCQIETLEALKDCEIEKNSFANKIFDLEEKAKSLMLLHEENFELKTSVNHHLAEIQLTKEHCEKLTAKIGKSKQCMKELEQKSQFMESAVEVSQKKVAELTLENQCLLSTLEQLSGSATQGLSNLAKEHTDSCDACAQQSTLLISAREALRTAEIKLKECEEEKEELNDNCQEKNKVLEKFEEEQMKLRMELQSLAANSAKFESLITSKENEIDTLSCQLSSVQQRLELRDQRVVEVSNQLNKFVSEEKIKNTKISKLTEKIKSVEKNLSSSQLEHSNSAKENVILAEKIAQYQIHSSENDKVIDELRTQSQQKEALNDRIQHSLEHVNSVLTSKTHEFTSRTASLSQKVEELSYSIQIYEKENQKLEESLKIAVEELGVLRTNAQREEETYRLAMDRAQLQMQKDAEVIDQHVADLRGGGLEVEALKRDRCDLDRLIREKELEIDSLNVRNLLLEKQLTDGQAEVDEVKKQMQHFRKESLLSQQLKIDLNDSTKEKKKMKHILTELNLKYDMVNRNLLEEKDRFLSEESKGREVASQLETLQFKFSYVEEELKRTKLYSQQLEENQRAELKSHIDKLNCTVQERDDALVKIRIIEVTLNRREKESKEFQHQIEELEKVVTSQNDELLRRGLYIQTLEKQDCSLQEHVKCSQLTIVERSREIDRLEQLVRDRSEEIELRSAQLQEFQIDLEKKLMEMETKVKHYEEKEEKYSAEYDKIKSYNLDLLGKSKCQKELLGDALKSKKEKEEEVYVVMKRNEDLKSENQTLDRCLQSSKDDLASKTSMVKDLHLQIRRKDKELEKISELMGTKMCDMAAKERQVKQLEEQTKKNRSSFTEIETKMKSELKLTRRRIESWEEDARKYNERVEKKHKLECNQIVEELNVKVDEMKKLSKEVEIISAKLRQSEEEVANIRMDMETHKSVLVDTENNCRLKGVVIGRLLKKLNMDSLKMYAEQLNESIEDQAHYAVEDDSRYADVYEGVSLPELIARITKTLECG